MDAGEMNLKRRLTKLENRTANYQGEPFRLFISVFGKPLNPATSAITRKWGPNGKLTEMVWLDGSTSGISQEEFETLVTQIPVTNTYLDWQAANCCLIAKCLDCRNA
jgi:hypothetical protein